SAEGRLYLLGIMSSSGGGTTVPPNRTDAPFFNVPLSDLDFVRLATAQTPDLDKIVVSFRAPIEQTFSKFGYRKLNQQLSKDFDFSKDIIDTSIQENAIYFSIH